MSTDYCVVTESNADKIQVKVKELIKQGWKPQGGLSMTSVGSGHQSTPIFAQAMIK